MKTRSAKALLALLLTFAMLCSMLSFTAFAAETDPFKRATELTEDDQFVFVIEYEGQTYAMDLVDSTLQASPVTVADGVATPSTATSIWWAREDEQLENAGSTADHRFLYASSSGLFPYEDGRSVAYDDASHCVLLHNNRYWLSFDGKVFGLAEDASGAVSVTLYGREMPKTAKEEKFIPDGSDIEPEVRDAVKGEDGSIKLAFVSDIHYSTGYPQMNLQVWLENVQDDVGYIDALGSCGDMGSAYAFVPALYWTYVSAIFDYMDGVVESGKIGSAIYTFGNHEWITSMGGDFTNWYNKHPAASRLLRVGEALRTDDYIFFCLGAGALAAKQKMGYSDEDIARIEEYLASAPKDIPIFVLTHFPLHCMEDRLCLNADKLIDVLNQHPNVVFLWGHNHSEFDPAYNTISHAGDKLVIDGQGTEKEINFTYLAAGCISDAEYTGGEGGSAWVQGKGLIVTINPDGSLKYEYYMLDGEPMEESGPYMVTFRENAYYSILERQQVEPGAAATAPEPPEIPNYTFTGWDTEFDKINGHTVVTAQYEFNYDLDPAYVYMTVQVGDTIACDTEGEPVIQYAIPYDPQMTVLEMIKEVEIAALGTDASEVTAVNAFGAISAYWNTTLPDTAKVLIPTSENYVATQDYVTPGTSYYFIVRESDDKLINPTYLSPFTGCASLGETVEFYAGGWGFNKGNMMYPRFAVNGDVLIGRSMTELEDTGFDAVDGRFSLTFSQPGPWYVAVRSEGNALAVNRIMVGISEDDYDEVIAIVHTNDVHGNIEVEPYVKGLADQLKRSGDYSLVLTVSAGDVYSGGKAVAGYYNGELIPAIMDQVYDVAVPGNNDFPAGGLAGNALLSALYTRTKTICANIRAKADTDVAAYAAGYAPKIGAEDFAAMYDGVALAADGSLDFSALKLGTIAAGASPWDETLIVETDKGTKLGLFGLTCTEGQMASMGDSQGSVAAAKAAVEALQGKADVIVGVAHTGWTGKGSDTPAQVNDANSWMVASAAQGMNALIDAHTHSVINGGGGCYVGNVLVNQAGAYGSKIGVMYFYLKDGKVVAKRAELIDRKDFDKITPDAAVQATVDAALERINAVAGPALVTTPVFLNGGTDLSNAGGSVRANETNMGDFVTDILRAAASEKTGTDYAFTYIPGYCVRASVEEDIEITKIEIASILGMQFRLAAQEYTAADIVALVSDSISAIGTPSAKFFQYSGLYITYRVENGVGVPVTIRVGEELIYNADRGGILVGDDWKVTALRNLHPNDSQWDGAEEDLICKDLDEVRELFRAYLASHEAGRDYSFYPNTVAPDGRIREYAAGGEIAFDDVPAEAWYYAYVTRLAEAGVINGFPDGTFRPAGTLTWAQAMKLLLCAHEDLADVVGAGWDATAMGKAAELGLCDAAQASTAEITRLEFCKAAAKLFAVTGTAGAFSDCDDADVLALVDFGVINGFPDGTFRPAETLTRAQISKIIYLLMK